MKQHLATVAIILMAATSAWLFAGGLDVVIEFGTLVVDWAKNNEKVAIPGIIIGCIILLRCIGVRGFIFFGGGGW